MRKLACAALGLLLLVAGAASVDAQQFTGGVRGAVRDPNGVIPGVTVTLTNEGTNVSREVVTNDVGQYNFPAVAPGIYTLKTQLTGYKTYESKGLVVGTQQIVTVDVLLQVGAIQESITVTGQTPLVETSNASTGRVLDRQALETLPTPGRNAFLVGVTVPSVNPVGDPQFNRQQDQTNASRISLGGGGIRANNYLVDGVPVTEMRGRAVANPTIEALEDVKVQVHTYDAEMGRTGGGVFNVTAKVGANRYHGSGFFQTRPKWGLTENFFNKKAGISKNDSGENSTFYHLGGGGGGGAIWPNRTFFWVATESYRTKTVRNLQEIWPGLNQRNGDFSRTTKSGVPVRLFNPFCRGGVATAKCPATGTGSLATGGEFTGAIIPLTHPAVSQVGLNILRSWPTLTNRGKALTANENDDPNAIGSASLKDRAQMYTFKVEHKITDKSTVSGFYLYNRTDEPGSTIFPTDKLFLAGDQGEFFGPLRRRPHIFVVNSTNVINDTTVATFRYGWTQWKDSCDSQPFKPGLQALGFNPAFVNALDPTGRDIFPAINFQDTATSGGGNGGFPLRWRQPYSINGSLTKLWGNHSIKGGGDIRKLVELAATETQPSGSFDFNRLFTSQNGAGGHEFASVLLGLPVSGSVPANRGRGNFFVKYYSGFIQDDWRVSSRLTLNYGLRLEHEEGLREADNKISFGFDESVVNPIDALVPKTGLLSGKTLKGGLLFAGVNGVPTEQGNPKTIKPAPRVGATFALDSKTVIRGGYGLFWAPWNFNTTQHGQIGFSRSTFLNQSTAETEVPLTTLDNPLPGGLAQPVGSSLGLLSSVGSTIDVVDRLKGNPRVHQYSADIQRELPGNMAITVGYVGATGHDIGFGGTNDASININQVDPAVARQLFPAPGGGWDAAALRQSVPNPFFGIAQAGELGLRPTVQRLQLLRPFPAFQDILVHERTRGGRRQYNSVEILLDKRVGQPTVSWGGLLEGLGGRFSYTYSRTRDNQFGETSTFQTRTNAPQNNLDLAAEFGRSNFDSPHRIILAPIWVLPGPSGRPKSDWRRILGSGWTVSSIVELVSGSPLNAVLSGGVSSRNLGLGGNVRQRPNVIGDPGTPGTDDNRVATGANPSARFFDRNAFANPGPGVFGNAPRTLTSARYQFRKNIDFVFSKKTRFVGGESGEVRFELLNVANIAKFRGINSNAIDQSSFGRITSQAGFMRIYQISFRYAF